MTESTNILAGTDDPAGPQYRVTGTLPVTVTVLANHTSHARLLAMATVAAVLAPHAGLFVDLNVDPQAARPIGAAGTEPDVDGEPRRLWRVPVSVAGHIDIAADDHLTAPVLALATIFGRLAPHPLIEVDATAATCAACEPITTAAVD
ncbi:hypothetical protein [Phytohabitans rumicis]|uniref:Uncharacterized protein n=1 Tax=Phytohabitans rumicis TaxID=1076125 RepID=A0A6V8LEE5_9ACTN|nr:hypothetical protein [Phytohabitans rumicis]GFJ93328.1 hypothetical protein Prum_069700 [Phytohabitans rumicis]